MTESTHRWLLGGGIGCGKSTVRALLEGFGVNTIDSDAIGHRVLEPDGPAFSDVAKTWPDALRDGRIDRSVLAGIVFSDPVQLATLESLTHPHIFGRIGALVEEMNGPVVAEIPLLLRVPPGSWRRLVVDSDDQVRLERLLSRGMTEDQALARMATQPSRGEWLGVADMVIPNHGDLEELATSVAQGVGTISRTA